MAYCMGKIIMITIAGDSYCHHPAKNGWQDDLRLILNKPIKIFASSGQSWWTTRKLLIEEKNNNGFLDTEIVIFCHTEGIRLPNRRNLPIGTYTVERPGFIHKGIAKAAKGYYQHIYDPNFSQWTYQCWIDECSTLFPEDAFIINLHSFSYSLTHLRISKGVSVWPALFSVSSAEFENDDEHFKYLERYRGDPRHNHLNRDNNKVLAEELANIITNRITGSYKIDSDRWYIKNIKAIQQHSSHQEDKTHLYFNK
jgi:hypothetical protein